MGLIDEFKKLSPSKGDWRVADIDENHIWDGSDHHPLCAYVRTRSDADFIVYSFKYLRVFVAEVERLTERNRVLENEIQLSLQRDNESKERSVSLEATIARQREIIEKLVSEPEDLFVHQENLRTAKEYLNGSNEQNAEGNLQ